MTVRGSNFGDLLAPGFREIFHTALKWKEYPSGVEKMFNVHNSSRSYEDDSYISGFGLVPDKNKGAAVTYDDAYQGYDKRYTHTTRALAYRVEKELYEDNLYSAFRKMPQALGRSMRVTIETDAANVYNRAENASYTGADGKVLLATDHPLLDGGSQKNRLTTAADLSATSWEQALIDIAETTDDRGLNLMLMPQRLIIPKELDWTAQKLFKSIKDPDSANHAINPAYGDIEVYKNNFLTDGDAWFVLCEGHEVNWFWRVKPDHYQGNDFDTDDAKFKVRARWSNGWSLPWGIFGSMGG